MDVLSDVLETVRLSGAIFMRGEFATPWGLYAPISQETAQVVLPTARNLIVFHIVAEGQCWFKLEGGDDVLANAGDMLVVPHGEAHYMGDSNDRTYVPVGELLPSPPWSQFPVLEHGGEGDATRILCGYLHCENAVFSPLFSYLPRLLHIRPDQGGLTGRYQSILDHILSEAGTGRLGNACLVARLTEVLFIEILRCHMEVLAQGDTGWLAALKDPIVGHAIRLMHAEPSKSWTVDQLARRVAASRSTLANRFKDLLGYPPIHYLARWRVQLATQLLAQSPVSIASVATAVGYESEAAFHRAFKRYLGEPPGAWRRRVMTI